MPAEFQTPSGISLEKELSPIERFIASLPNANYTDASWFHLRGWDIEKYGPEAMLGVFPYLLRKDVRSIVRSYNVLQRAGIKTITDALNLDLKKIPQIRAEGKEFGKKSINLLLAVRETVSLERERESAEK